MGCGHRAGHARTHGQWRAAHRHDRVALGGRRRHGRPRGFRPARWHRHPRGARSISRRGLGSGVRRPHLRRHAYLCERLRVLLYDDAPQGRPLHALYSRRRLPPELFAGQLCHAYEPHRRGRAKRHPTQHEPHERVGPRREPRCPPTHDGPQRPARHGCARGHHGRRHRDSRADRVVPRHERRRGAGKDPALLRGARANHKPGHCAARFYQASEPF